jgi:hypothetical protein
VSWMGSRELGRDGEEAQVTLVGTAESVRALLLPLTPFDAVEADHHAKALAWLRATDDVFRREKPATSGPWQFAALRLHGRSAVDEGVE